MTELERLNKAIKQAFLDRNISKKAEMADFLGYKSPYFSGLINGKVGLNESFYEKISAKLGVNITWIKTGEGEMLKTDTPKSGVSTEEGGVISIPRDAWEVIRNQSASLKAKDEQLGMLAASLKAKDEQINTLISQNKSDRDETIRVISILEKELAKKGEDAGYPSHVAIRADTE